MKKLIVYEYTEKAGGLRGNRYITTYDETSFKEQFPDGVTSRDGSLRVVAKDLELKDAERLCAQVDLGTQISGAIQLSTQRNGKVNPTMLEMNLENLRVALITQLRQH